MRMHLFDVIVLLILLAVVFYHKFLSLCNHQCVRFNFCEGIRN